MNYEILISINLGDNFPLKDDFLSKDCRVRAILEAKFNDELLQSDPIEIFGPNPELATELGFRVNKKDFHQFRTERKSIKLQCFVEYSTLIERHFIGYIVLHLRDAQDYTHDPKYKWIVLLNPKYKGSSNKRPQLYLALMVNKFNDNPIGICDAESLEASMTENQFTRSIKKDKFNESTVSFDFCTNMLVEITDPYIFIWNKNNCDKEDCFQEFTIHIQMNKPKNLINLFNDQVHSNCQYFFKYILFGKQIKTESFSDLTECNDFQVHKHSVNLRTFNKDMLQEYFESYPTIEIQFCSTKNELIGFVTINLLKLFQQNNAFIYGNFVVVPEEESVYVKDPFPIVNLRLFLLSKNKNDTYLERPIDYINHYYIAIDLRTIKLVDTESFQILFQPFYLQFSYAFFGETEPIKTYPSIKFLEDNPEQEITIPHGFCGFNLATTYEKLCYTFENLPLIIQLILDQDNTLLGTSEIDLKCLLKKTNSSSDDLNDNFVNILTHVYDELNDKICEIQVIMFIQELFDNIPSDEQCSSLSSKQVHFDDTLTAAKLSSDCSKLLKTLNGDFGKKESTSHITEEKLFEKEKQLDILLKKLNERERILFEQEKILDRKQEEIDRKLTNSDIDAQTVLQEIRIEHQDKINQLNNKIHTLEQEKFKYQEKNYQLERKMKEKNSKIRELEAKVFELTQINKRKQHMDASTSNPNNPRKIIITRDFQE